MINRYPILNIWTDCVTQQQAIDQLDNFVNDGNRLHTIFSSNPEKNYSVPADPALYTAFKESDLLLPDGIGVVLAMRFLHHIKIQRLPGCEFMINICDHAQLKGYTVYIYGGTEEVNNGAVLKLSQIFPHLKIVGHCHGYWPDEHMDELIKRINDSAAQILFLALGSPKQEQWIERYRKQLTTVRVCQGIGGTLDVIYGNVRRAPAFFCRYGLEWLYRLISEPRRINRQWVLPLFAAQIFGMKIKSAFIGK